jgi:hypothetical protein
VVPYWVEAQAAVKSCNRRRQIHFHILFLDGDYVSDGADPPAFCPVAAPGADDLQGLIEQVAVGVGQVLERRGLIERDIENVWLAALPLPLAGEGGK